MMFLLDTHVVSALRRRDRADPAVVAWADAVPVAQVYLSAITVLELELGILRTERRDAARARPFVRGSMDKSCAGSMRGFWPSTRRSLSPARGCMFRIPGRNATP
jgi:hypothetical protein